MFVVLDERRLEVFKVENMSCFLYSDKFTTTTMPKVRFQGERQGAVCGICNKRLCNSHALKSIL